MSNLESEDIDIQEIIKYLWTKKITIFLVTFVCAVSSIFYSLSIPNQYRAEVTLSPTDTSGNSIAGSMTSQMGGIASLAGINLGSMDSPESLQALEIMQSWGFIETFINDNQLLIPLVATKGWNKNNNTLIIDNNIYDSENNKWIKNIPTSFKLFENLRGRIGVIKNVETKMITVSMDHYSPSVAKELLELYIKAINDHMRLRKLTESNMNIEFLGAQLNKTSIKEMKDILFTIIETETKNIMLAKARPEYAFSTVSKAMVAEEKFKPKRSRIVILYTFFGGLLTTLGFLFVYTLRRKYST